MRPIEGHQSLFLGQRRADVSRTVRNARQQRTRPRGGAFVSVTRRVEPEPRPASLHPGRRAVARRAGGGARRRRRPLRLGVVVGEYVTAFEEGLRVALRSGPRHRDVERHDRASSRACGGRDRPEGRSDRALPHVRRHGGGRALSRRDSRVRGLRSSSLVYRSRRRRRRISSAHPGCHRRRSLRPSRRHGHPRRDRGRARASSSWKTRRRRSAPSTASGRPAASAGSAS